MLKGFTSLEHVSQDGIDVDERLDLLEHIEDGEVFLFDPETIGFRSRIRWYPNSC